MTNKIINTCIVKIPSHWHTVKNSISRCIFMLLGFFLKKKNDKTGKKWPGYNWSPAPVAETCCCDALSARLLSRKVVGRSSGNRIKLLCYIWHQFRAGKPLCTFTIINGKPLVCSVGCLPLRMCERFAVLPLVVPTENIWLLSSFQTIDMVPFFFLL